MHVCMLRILPLSPQELLASQPDTALQQKHRGLRQWTCPLFGCLLSGNYGTYQLLIDCIRVPGVAVAQNGMLWGTFWWELNLGQTWSKLEVQTDTSTLISTAVDAGHRDPVLNRTQRLCDSKFPGGAFHLPLWLT
jgi:hypothetical protein